MPLHADGSLRITGGPNTTAGRLEVYLEAVWGTVCDDGWDDVDADVACRQLGYPGGRALKSADKFCDAPSPFYSGSNPQPIWLTGVACVGSEARLVACPSGGSGMGKCGHKEDAGVICNPKTTPPPTGSGE